MRALLLLLLLLMLHRALLASAWRIPPSSSSRRLRLHPLAALRQSLTTDGASTDNGGMDGIAAHQQAMEGFDVAAVVVHEDAHVVVVNKPPNALCVPGRYIEDSLVVRVAAHLGIEDFRRMVVHRLDQGTSGLVVLAKNEAALKHLHAQLRDKAEGAAATKAPSVPGGGFEKHYVALVSGNDLEPAKGSIALPIRKDVDNPPKQMVDFQAGKPSLTRYRVRARGADRCLVGLEPVTGRTHQLRVHLAAIGHPILGDPFYATHRVQALSPERLCLHAEALAFLHPATGERVAFSAPYPEGWDAGLDPV